MKLHIHRWYYLNKWQMSQYTNSTATMTTDTTIFSWVCRCGNVKNVVKKNENQPPQFAIVKSSQGGQQKDEH